MDLWNIATMLITAGAVYGAIRADIKNIHDRLTRVENKVYE